MRQHVAATFHRPFLLYACIVIDMAAPNIDPRTRLKQADQLAQLRFLHEVARLATTARTWDELLETVVDGTRDALHADVSSLYLLDRDGAYLTLAATTGLDRFQIGRARVPYGEGVTGHVAATREPLVIPDVGAEPRFLWVRGLDQRRYVASMLSVPLSWHDQDRRRPQRPDGAASRSSARTTSPSSARSPTCSPGSSRRAASRSKPRPGSRRFARSTRPAAS